MISKNKLKWVNSLQRKKIRDREDVFIAEGHKVVGDLLQGGYECVWKAEVGKASDNGEVVTDDDLRRLSLLETPQDVFAVLRQKHYDWDESVLETGLCLALDGVQNPGNVGTILRIADWFGVEHVLCSHGCADVYNPKTVQATMGALAHVKVHYVDLPAVLKSVREHSDVPVLGTFLDGKSIYATESLPESVGRGIIVMGNEGNGISSEVGELVTHRLLIPNYPEGRATTDSLNVAIATAVVCAELRRRQL